MKRFASVFKKSKKTSVVGKDNDDTTPKSPRSPLPVSRSTPGLIPGGSSASSSTVSADLRTPDDDHASNRFPSPSPPSTSRPKKAWIQSWVGSRRSTSSRSIASSEVYEDSRRPEPPPIAAVPPLPRLAQPPPPSTPTQRKQQHTTKAPAPVARISQDDDATSSESDDDYNEQVITPRRVHHAPTPSTVISPQTLHKAAMNVRQLTFQSLVPPFSPPPLLHLPGKALFPRSANPLSVLVRQESLRSRTLRAQILRRLDKTPLPAIDARTIAPFANREIGDKHKRSSFILDENAVSGAHTKRIGSSSSGLRRWANRPPFEDRFSVWISDAGQTSQMSVVTARPGFAVASLELSDEVHLLAGLDHDELTEVTPTASTPTGGKTNSRSHRPSPSPLRMEHTGLRSASSPALVPSAPVTTSSPLSASPSTPTSTSPSSAKLGVRFSNVEDDPSDTVPLGYTQRLHQQRADKARFLQEEQARRHAEEARLMQAERAQWEAERAQWAQERKAEQDARRQRELAEQYVAARERQNRERQGFTPESSRTHSKAADIPKPEPRRQWSEPNSVRIKRESSPVSSGPPSVASGRSKYPTPASSVEDVRTRKRSSMNGSEAASDRGRSRRASAVSTRSQSYAALPPPLPLDAPLLPPTAPFMQEAGGRSRVGSHSRNSPSESPSPALSSSGGSSSGGSQRGSTRGSLYAGSRSAEQVSRAVSSPHNYSRPSLHARQSSGSGASMHSNRPMSVAMPMMYPIAPAAGPATPPAGYWMVPVPMAAYPSPMGMPVQMPMQMHVSPMPMQAPSPAGSMSKRSRQSVIF